MNFPSTLNMARVLYGVLPVCNSTDLSNLTFEKGLYREILQMQRASVQKREYIPS